MRARFVHSDILAIEMVERAGKFLIRDTHRDPSNPVPKHRLSLPNGLLYDSDAYVFWYDLSVHSSQSQNQRVVRMNGHLLHVTAHNLCEYHDVEASYVTNCPSGDGCDWRPDHLKVLFTAPNGVKTEETFSPHQLRFLMTDESYIRGLEELLRRVQKVSIRVPRPY